jgi:muconolactone delta-isomerase
MLFLINFETDSGALGQVAPEKIQELVRAEWQAGLDLYRSGRLLRIYFNANGGGAIGIFDFPNHDQMQQAIRALPFFRYFSRISITPLVGHPLYPHFAQPDPGAKTYEPPKR